MNSDYERLNPKDISKFDVKLSSESEQQFIFREQTNLDKYFI